MTTEPAQTTTLGRSGLKVSRIAFGTRQLGGDRGRFDEAEATNGTASSIPVGGPSPETV